MSLRRGRFASAAAGGEANLDTLERVRYASGFSQFERRNVPFRAPLRPEVPRPRHQLSLPVTKRRARSALWK